MIKNLFIVSAAGTDPRFNLAAESALMDQVRKDELILYLWQNDNTVVIGRNQNVYKECNLKNMEKDHVSLVRRSSGGGAVYHDLGNLNFTFLSDDENYSVERQSLVIVQALAKRGLDAEISGRNDLLIDGHKFSGNAYYHHHGFSFQHGTLLIHSDLSKMPRYLNPDPLKLKANSVASVRSRVVNLCEYDPDLSIELMKELLIQAAEEVYGLKAEIIPLPAENQIQSYDRKYSCTEWIYGKNPPFDLEISNRFAWGGIEMRFAVKNGVIGQCAVHSDSMEPDTIDEISALLTGCSFTKKDILNRLSAMKISSIVSDIADWLNLQEI